ncbi:MAG: Gfo/Idh/MocA family protein, partial [Bradyrhizobium sp.]
MEGRATVVVSRDAGKARAFAQALDIPGVAQTVEDAARHPDVDAMYIASPPTSHLEQALICFAAGRPALIEKPLASSRADAEAIAEAARAARVFCMEAMWTAFLPLVEEVSKSISSGAIGDIRSFSGSLGFANAPDPTRSVFNAALGGGALLRRGIYPLAMAMRLFGSVTRVESTARIGETGVDDDSTVLLHHQTGVLSTICASLRTSLPNDMRISGTHGSIHVEAPIFRPFEMRLTPARPMNEALVPAKFESLRESGLAQGVRQRFSRVVRFARNGGTSRKAAYHTGNGFNYEADEVMRCVRSGKLESDTMKLSDSVDTLAV